MSVVTRRICTAAAACALLLSLAAPLPADEFRGTAAYRKGDFTSARAEFGVEANSSPVSRFFLAIMALRGEGGARDVTRGVSYLRASVAQGYYAAAYLLATWNLYGAGSREPARATQLLATAAGQGDYRATALLKILAKGSKGERQDLKEVAAAVKKAAQGGDHDAQYTLAFMHLIGDGVPRDVSQEIRWYKAAAAGGNARAAFMLALMHLHGEGVAKNAAESARYMRISAEHGNVPAAFFLGTFYYHGTGVTRDRQEAALWIGRAARAGYGEARAAYGMLLLSGDGVATDKVAAMDWLGQAARDGNENARAVLRELVSFRGQLLGGPALDPRMATAPEPELRGKVDHDLQPRLEGKGVVLDKGAFSLKFSMPDVRDAYVLPGAPARPAEQDLLNRMQGGKFEIIFRPDKP